MFAKIEFPFLPNEIDRERNSVQNQLDVLCVIVKNRRAKPLGEKWDKTQNHKIGY